MKYPDMPTVCRECEGQNLSLDHAVRLNHVVGPIEAWDEVWLGCDDCSETLWNGTMADFMPLLNDLRTVLPILKPTLQAVVTHAIDTYTSALAPIIEALAGIED